MSKDVWDAVDAYIDGLLVGPDDALDAALRSSQAAGLPRINVSPPQGKLLHLLARAAGARRILEIGTLGGYSAIWLGRTLPPGGKLLTLEIDAKHADVARANFERAGLAAVIEVRVGPALETLPLLASEDPFDFVFIDADKPGYPDYFAWSLRLSRPGTLIVADNVVRDGAVIDAASDDANVQGVRRMTKIVAAEPRVTSTAIQVVGTKGYDGLLIALVKD
jgi:predicted O-methyltransferase YrrM